MQLPMNASKPQSSILWLQVCGLAAMQGAITLTWVAYNLYLPRLLIQFGFPQQLATTLLIIEAGLTVVLEPIFGGLSDEAQRWSGSRFPFIAVGVVLASALSIAIPAVVAFGNLSTGIRWLLPGVMVAWALAMAIFRSPALCLLGRYASAPNLPRAASVLTLIGGMAGATEPLASQFILSLGPVITFSTGSILLLGAAAMLRFTNPQASITSSKELTISTASRWLSVLRLGLIFVTGTSITLGFRVLVNALPKVLIPQLPGANVGLMTGKILVTLFLAAIPAGVLAVRIGNRRAMLIGLGAMIGFSGLSLLAHGMATAMGIGIALGISFSLVSNGAIPFALTLAPLNNPGLGIGMYFGGGALAVSLFKLGLNPSNIIAPNAAILLAAIAFLVAAACITFSRTGTLNTAN